MKTLEGFALLEKVKDEYVSPVCGVYSLESENIICQSSGGTSGEMEEITYGGSAGFPNSLWDSNK